LQNSPIKEIIFCKSLFHLPSHKHSFSLSLSLSLSHPRSLHTQTRSLSTLPPLTHTLSSTHTRTVQADTTMVKPILNRMKETFAEYHLFYRALLQKRPTILERVYILSVILSHTRALSRALSRFLCFTHALSLFLSVSLSDSHTYTHTHTHTHTHTPQADTTMVRPIPNYFNALPLSLSLTHTHTHIHTHTHTHTQRKQTQQW